MPAADDPLTDALTEGELLRRELLVEAGGTLTTDEVAHLLRIRSDTVESLQLAGALLAIPSSSSGWAYPRRQFRADGTCVQGLDAALRAIDTVDPWVRFHELLAPNDDLGGRSALQVLRDDPASLPLVIHVLSAYGRHGA